MKIYQKSIRNEDSIESLDFGFEPNLVLLFVSPGYSGLEKLLATLSSQYVDCTVTGCSTSGEILDVSVSDDTVALTAIKFEKSKHKLVHVNILESESDVEAGRTIRESLDGEDLKHILLFSVGLLVNGADLVLGLSEGYDKRVTVTGGLAGDGLDNWTNTFVIRDGEICNSEIVGIGLYGKDLKVGYGSKGGWDSFGIERLVTRSEKNVLFEIDGKPALELYKSYLGDKASSLPLSGLMFPLSMRTKADDPPVVRTIVDVNEEDKSLIFAGNIPEGSYVRLMKANLDRLINGAEASAETTKSLMNESAELALLVSCVGRRLVLKQLIDEEVEVVREVLGDEPKITGFYSLGELAPFGKFQPCQLHNQTMTITTLSE